ncbi:helix-turn-helix domain-containing protein [Bacillus thuringiensis]|uniref:helix-turn-helix domain-containing protein n=1 Tax=Bacillus thuringiensis TaxID=1428 RepID=UPI00222585C3|nr:helix-turn-helix transcriptional regulator [Bacillus thuringiensis]UYX53328.1 helix-turn-helix domain-containing protein [Bacillus thuringiensis]
MNFNSKKLALILSEHEVSQRQLSQELGKAKGTVSGYVNGTIQPPFAVICKMADILSVSVECFREDRDE